MNRRLFLKLFSVVVVTTALATELRTEGRNKSPTVSGTLVPEDSYLSNIAELNGVTRAPDESDESLKQRVLARYVK